ncbi:chemotaxis protein CheW [Helicovermis profundi]|uniref:Chemotaxis protein CheW n=1 Tax=Helicovermis profundi TaxID=3065157 RepID=A0AAU9ENR6_9FIRM|nr:chemotaxis protein CheW [Clostridia bacterium S502]
MAENQYVTFLLGNEKYCIDIENVAGISENVKVTKVPDAPYYLQGIMNLRGDVIPVINLKKRFNIEETTYSEDSKIILINIEDNSLGFLVDEANQVVKIDETDIDPTPEVIKRKGQDYISSIGKLGGELYIILAFEKILNHDETETVLNFKK